MTTTKTGIRSAAALAAILSLTLVAAACTSGDSSTETATRDRSHVELDVSLNEFAISPARMEAPAGQPIVLHVANEGTAPHSLAVDTGKGVEETPLLDSGESAVLELQPLEAGDYATLCTVAGHAEAGMTGTLTIGATAGAVGATGHQTTSGGMTVEEMLEGHAAGVEAFPAETQAEGNQPLEATIENGVKIFRLSAQEVEWETEPGVFVHAMGYNGIVPGPEIRVRRGDHVRIVMRNDMTQPTTLHLHGLTVPNGMDGVPFVTQDPIVPGGFFVYEFEVVDPPGMYVYHSHFNSTEQVGSGLYGAFYVEPKRGDWSRVYGERVDVESTLFLGDGPTGFVLNGKGFPATQPIVAERGNTVLVHLANDGSMIHPMHLHGYHFEVVAADGFVLDETYMADTLMVAPGQRFDILIHANAPGVWAYHCHILPHVEGPEGMFGMVTALVVQ
jgi:FtsP/CotA-like multicopper oxidase with cupredoxin domain